MKKVVINTCFGGFSLSLEAQRRYLELKGKKAYFFKMNLSDESYEPLQDGDSELFSSTYTVPNPQDYLKNGKNWHSMTPEEKEAYNNASKKISFYEGDLDRDDPILIQVVEELKKKANGRCAELKIIKIPDNVKWEIEEYDGNEHIAEKHRTWR